MPATDVGRSLAWYERILGRPPDERRDGDGASWVLSEGGSITVMRDPEKAGTAAITLVVEDLDGSLAALAARGVETGAVQTVRGRLRRAVVLDPDGNRLVFAESL